MNRKNDDEELARKAFLTQATMYVLFLVVLAALIAHFFKG